MLRSCFMPKRLYLMTFPVNTIFSIYGEVTIKYVWFRVTIALLVEAREDFCVLAQTCMVLEFCSLHHLLIYLFEI